ncbi:hypothetical protein NLI96_g10986 [Meripilus lineatus]|uniref:Hydrophobin n=1 Tax=Meripilus lineatus TaxID=2056292 RepID=A0AAD5YDT6_9APHY|nr:hypothetical protein NLI96_g10986 [Physisporinus lineatus]
MFSRPTQTIISALFFFIVFVTASPVSAPLPSADDPTPVVTAAPTATPTGSSGNCNTGPMQCCNSLQSSNSGGLGALLGLLGVIGPLTGLIGLDCSPISVIGAGSGGCSATPVCCENNNVGGLLSVWLCAPLSLSTLSGGGIY